MPDAQQGRRVGGIWGAGCEKEGKFLVWAAGWMALPFAAPWSPGLGAGWGRVPQCAAAQGCLPTGQQCPAATLAEEHRIRSRRSCCIPKVRLHPEKIEVTVV